MEKLLKEAPAESLEPESTAKSPDVSRTDSKEDNWVNQNEEEVDDQTNHKTAEQLAQSVSGQTDHKDYEPPGRRTYDQADLRASDHANVAQPGTFDQDDQRIYEKTSGQAHRDSKVSLLHEQRTSVQIDHGMSSQALRRTSEQIDSRLSGLVERRTSEPMGYSRSNQVDPRTSIKTHHTVYHQEATELATQQTADLVGSSADHLTVDKTDSSDDYMVDHLMDEENYSRKDSLADYEAPGQEDDRILTQSGDSKEYKEAEFRVEPCKFEARKDHDSSWVSAETDTESVTNLQAFDSFDARFISNFQAKDQVYSQRFPSTSPKLDYVVGQEKTKAIENKLDDIPEYQEGSLGYGQTYMGQFPPIVYEDPYQVALQYMEKHHILQIFQITENLVYEKPEDPLHFMLYKIQEMIENRDKCETYKE
ncbi:testis-specific expressed protein 55 isoform X2 [Suricata suricatta]|uniref:testis-specific expressed protein 55 isoform X2 n=1 Tax=Suricata suricatta TaxID=37032 RepID=UPI0011555BC5|nr:testis-specific expressed protein 55 isoform X2 [Suricata suricatta]